MAAVESASIPTLRRRAKRVYIRFYKSTWRRDTIDNAGKYQVCCTWHNVVIEGPRYDATLEDVVGIVEARERQGGWS